MTLALVFGHIRGIPHMQMSKLGNGADVLRGNYALASEKAGTLKQYGVPRSLPFSLHKHGLIRAHFTDTNH